MRTIAIAGTFDSKGAEYQYIKGLVEELGLRAYTIHTGVFEPMFEPDVSNGEVAAAAGYNLEEIAAKKDRSLAMEALAKGMETIVPKLYADGKFDGILSLGGSGGTSLATAAMRALPIGVPKLMVSTMASGDVERYVGTSDIIMMPSIVDVAGLNKISKMIFKNAVLAMAGMVSCGDKLKNDTTEQKPLIAATMFGVTTPCIEQAKVYLEEKGYEVMVFHATGTGGKTMEAEIILSRELYTMPDVTLAAYSNGVSIDHVYNKNYTVTSNCSNVSWNNKYQGVDISFNDSIPINCELEYTENNTTAYLNDYIIDLAGTTQGTGQVVQENGYRYEGKDPNNYIWFNNELWRIIGVFDETSHGVSGQNLVKIIRNESIGGLVWDKDGVNDWNQASLMNLLNGAYLNSQNGTGGEYCYLSLNISGNCDYTETGINDTYRPMIENVTWHLGGYSSTSATAEAFYGYERGTTVYSGRPTSAEGYIGLMYPSDYGYSVLAISCARTTNLDSYSNTSCAGQSWLYGTGWGSSITPLSSNSNYVFDFYFYGDLTTGYVAGSSPVQPVLYLDAYVYIIDGNGSISDPYIIGV